MAGYQVQNQNFFVNLNKGDNTENQIAFLQDTYTNPASVFVNTSTAIAFDLYAVATGAHNGIVGALFIFSGAATAGVSVTLPTAAAILADMSQEILDQYGNQLLNVPSTQRAYLDNPALGANFKFSIFNKTGQTITLVEPAGGNTNIVAGQTIDNTKVGIVTATLVNQGGAVDPSVTYTLSN